MHIIITRPKEESLNLINRLIKSGHSVTHLPVIKIEKLEVFKKAKSVGIEIFREKTKNNPSKKVGKIFKIKK